MLTHIYLFFCMTQKYLDSALFVFQNEQLSLAQFSGYFFHQSLILHDATMKFNLKNYMRCSYITLQIEHSWLIEQRDLCFSFFSFLVSFPFLFPPWEPNQPILLSSSRLSIRWGRWSASWCCSGALAVKENNFKTRGIQDILKICIWTTLAVWIRFARKFEKSKEWKEGSPATAETTLRAHRIPPLALPPEWGKLTARPAWVARAVWLIPGNEHECKDQAISAHKVLCDSLGKCRGLGFGW